jgi:hypothetical protein
MEVKEGAATAVERAARFLLQLRPAPQDAKSRFKSVECVRPGMLHPEDCAELAKNGKLQICAIISVSAAYPFVRLRIRKLKRVPGAAFFVSTIAKASAQRIAGE